jgi:hypothetical protein
MQCPHYLTHFHESWTATRIGKDKDSHWDTCVTTCPACERFVIGLLRGPAPLPHPPQPSQRTLTQLNGLFTLVHPKAISRTPLSSEVPKEFAADYREACLVLPDSEKASAALSRRCLQHLLHDKIGIKEHTLADEIQKLLDSKHLPSHRADELDAIRHVGNFAAHPLKSTNSGEIVEVEPHEAEWLLNLLEGLFDF